MAAELFLLFQGPAISPKPSNTGISQHRILGRFQSVGVPISGKGVFRADFPPAQCGHNGQVFRKVGCSKLDSITSAVQVGPLQGSLPQLYSNAKDVLAVGRIQRQTGIEQVGRFETDGGRGSSDRLL
jgi:hypothetical protein